jgi:ABC-2 type transport system ATP-binding protein
VTAAHVHAQAVRLHLGGFDVLDGVDLLAQGGIVAVLGANGAGKTSLLRCITTLVSPQDGTVRVDGLNPDREVERIEIRRRLGYLPQRVGFDRGSTAYDALDYLAVLKEHRNDRVRRRLVAAALERVGLSDRASTRVASLSGGMQQRLGLAQAILGSPSLIVLDEPAAGLDPDERFRFRDIVAERRQSATLIVSTHLTDEAADADSVVVLAGGRVRFAGPPARLVEIARGRTWVQAGPPGNGVRASWRQADGRYRCLGTPVPGPNIDPVAPRLEDGYLLVVNESPVR